MGFAWFSMSTIWFGYSLHHRPPRLYLKSVEFEFFWGIIRKQTKKIRPKICLENILETFRLESVYGKSQGRHSLICPKRVCTSQQGMVSGYSVCKQVQQVYDAITLFRVLNMQGGKIGPAACCTKGLEQDVNIAGVLWHRRFFCTDWFCKRPKMNQGPKGGSVVLKMVEIWTDFVLNRVSRPR